MASGLIQIDSDRVKVLDGALCKSCTYCCWAYAASGVPVSDEAGEPTEERYEKLSMEECPHRAESSCRIHSQVCYPADCRKFVCPYLQLETDSSARIRSKHNGQVIRFRIHRPDSFRAVIEEVLDPNVKGLVFPAVPVEVSLNKARRLIFQTGCVPVIEDGEWHLQMLTNSKDPQVAMDVWRNRG